MAPLHYPGLGFLVIVLLVHREGTRLFQNCVGPGRLLQDTWRESGIRSDGAFYESHSLNGSNKNEDARSSNNPTESFL